MYVYRLPLLILNKSTKEKVVTGMYHPVHYKIQEDRRFR